MSTTCSVEGCELRVKARALCNGHYQRLSKYGSPTGQPNRPSNLERFMARVDKAGDCWEWTGYIDPTEGYGRFALNRKPWWAHRAGYELLVGPIPKGRQIDHLCRNRRCVNPAHLEAVSQKVNILRGESPGARAARTNRCQRDHEFTPENTYWRPDGGGRQCRKCIRLRSLKRSARVAA